MIFLIINILNINFCVISFKTKICNIPQILKKLTTSTSSKLCLQKLYQCHLLKYVYCMQKFVWFHAIESEIDYHKNFGKNRIAALLQIYMHPNCIIIFLTIEIVHINFYAISLTRNQDQLIPKNLVKMSLKRYLLSNFHQKLIDINLC